MNEYIVLVDENDNPIGKEEKLKAHQLGLLHRAFSIFIFNTNGQLLLQQRADQKYHSAGLWSNSCCSHPIYGEDMEQAVKRRLQEELNLECPLEFAFSFTYKIEFPNGLIENEFDHVYIGITNDLPNLNQLEVKDWKYIDWDELEKSIKQSPEEFTAWLKICMPQVKSFIQSPRYNHLSTNK